MNIGDILMKVKNIILDVGGVLAEYTENWLLPPNMYHILEKKYIDEKILQEKLKELTYLQTKNQRTIEEEIEMFTNYYYHVLEAINYPYYTKDLAKKLALDCVYNKNKYTFYEDVIPMLETLSKTYNLYIISNGWPSSYLFLREHQIEKYVKKIYISSLWGSSKLDRLFDIFLEQEKDVNPKETYYIDDQRNMIEKASKYGFHLILMDRKKLHFKVAENLNDVLETIE